MSYKEISVGDLLQFRPRKDNVLYFKNSIKFGEMDSLAEEQFSQSEALVLFMFGFEGNREKIQMSKSGSFCVELLEKRGGYYFYIEPSFMGDIPFEFECFKNFDDMVRYLGELNEIG